MTKWRSKTKIPWAFWDDELKEWFGPGAGRERATGDDPGKPEAPRTAAPTTSQRDRLAIWPDGYDV